MGDLGEPLRRALEEQHARHEERVEQLLHQHCCLLLSALGSAELPGKMEQCCASAGKRGADSQGTKRSISAAKQRPQEFAAIVPGELLASAESPRKAAREGQADASNDQPGSSRQTSGPRPQDGLLCLSDCINLAEVPEGGIASSPTASAALQAVNSNRDTRHTSRLDPPYALKRFSAEIREIASAQTRVVDRSKSVLKVESSGDRWSSSSAASRLSCHRLGEILTQHRMFEVAVATLIVSNALFMGIQTDLGKSSMDPGIEMLCTVLEHFFQLAFTCELVLRIWSEKWKFLLLDNRNFFWNVFDTLIVFSEICDFVLRIATQETSWDATSLRMLRLFRMVRILRIIRVMQFFHELRVMLKSIANSFKSLGFALLLLLLIMYVFAVLIQQISVAEQTDRAEGHGSLSDDKYQELLRFYSSLPRTMLTLYLSILSGLDWGDALEVLLSLSPFLAFLMAGYIAFTILCVLNIVTGVFVESANKITAQDEEHMLLKDFASRREWLANVSTLFSYTDRDGSGELDWEEFAKRAADPEVQAWFRKVGCDLETEHLKGLFDLFDLDGDGFVNLEEFVSTLQHVKGTAKSIDMMRVKYEMSAMNQKLTHWLEDHESCGGCQQCGSACQSRPTERLDRASSRKSTRRSIRRSWEEPRGPLINAAADQVKGVPPTPGTAPPGWT